MIRLSLCMITKNEVHNIERCLKSVEGLVNEIIIVDTGSTDGTIKLAEKLNANVFEHEIVPFSFSKARNIALDYALGSWILHLDADEELSKESIPIIEEIVKTDNKRGYICDVINSLPNGELGYFKSIRLFKNSRGIKYIRDCHEEIYFSLEKQKYEVLKGDIRILHYGYCVDKKTLESKAKRNLEILFRMYRRKEHWLTAYQIGQSFFALEKYHVGKMYLRKALKHPLITEQFKFEIQNILSQIG